MDSFSTNKGRDQWLHTVPSDGSQPPRQLPTDAIFSEGRFSWQDQNWVIYEDYDEYWRVYRINIHGVEPELISAGRIEGFLGYDSEWIVIRDSAGGLYRVRTDGSSREPLFDLEEDETIRLSLSGYVWNERWVVFEVADDRDRRIYRVERDGSSLEHLFTIGKTDSVEAISPNVDAMVIKRAGGISLISTANPTGTPLPEINAPDRLFWITETDLTRIDYQNYDRFLYNESNNTWEQIHPPDTDFIDYLPDDMNKILIFQSDESSQGDTRNLALATAGGSEVQPIMMLGRYQEVAGFYTPPERTFHWLPVLGGGIVLLLLSQSQQIMNRLRAKSSRTV